VAFTVVGGWGYLSAQSPTEQENGKMNGISGRRLRVVLALVPLAVAAGNAIALEFRIETKVYQQDEEQPVSEAVTLFQGGVVYDFLSSPQQIAVFRKPTADRPGRFILLDPVRQQRTELTTDRIAAALEKLSDWAVSQPDPLLRFAAAPKFQESFDAETGRLVLTSYLRTYVLETSAPAKPESLGEYREFLDWYAQLNALMNTHEPPQPRLAVNAALAKHAVVPTRVELRQSAPAEPVWAKHDFVWRLSQEDQSRIDEVRNAMGSYRDVSNEEFLQRE
jgi:hypothetical protein